MIDEHERIDLLLPWHVSGTLEAEESGDVRHHMANCVTCRGQLRELAELSSVVREAPTPSFDTDSHLLDVEHRLAAITTRKGHETKPVLPRSGALRWLLVGQVAALVLMATLLLLRHADRPGLQPNDTPQFRTLATPPADLVADSPRVRVLFSEGVTEQLIRELLHRAGGRIVDGPSAMGLYVVELDMSAEGDSSLASRLEALRTHDGVRFAELEGPVP